MDQLEPECTVVFMHCNLNSHFRAAGLTNPGQLRQTNEDNFLIDANAGLLVVADGMGGHQSGELASADAIRVLQEKLTEETRALCTRRHTSDGETMSDSTSASLDLVIERTPGKIGLGNGANAQACGEIGQSRVASAIAAANDVINSLNIERGYGPREAMGTTVVGLYTQPHCPMDATIFHVGDSRFYLFRNGILDQITRDHSAYENWLQNGSNGPAPGLHILSQAIGPSDLVVPGIQHHTFQAGDVVLLCSDGLTNLVSDDDIKALLGRLDSDDLAAGCQELVDAAQANGGTDNITVVLGAYTNH
jgi:protein phosphatase